MPFGSAQGRPTPATSEHPCCNLPRALLTAVVAGAVCAAVAAPWFLAMSARHGEAFGGTFFLNEHLRRILHPMQGHGGPFWVYLPVIFLGFFPWVVFLPAGMLHRREEDTTAQVFWHGLCAVWIAVVLVGFSAISTKLPGYVTPLYPAMALLVGAELDRRLDQPGSAPWLGVMAGVVLLVVGLALLPPLAARYAVKAAATAAVPLLAGPVLSWVAAYVVIFCGALLVLSARPRAGVAALALGQVMVVAAVLYGILPVVSPYLEGGRESRLAHMALGTRGWYHLVVYETRPEAVAFVRECPVLSYGKAQRAELLAMLRRQRTILIAPTDEESFWTKLGGQVIGRSGDHMVLEIYRITEPEEAPP